MPKKIQLNIETEDEIDFPEFQYRLQTEFLDKEYSGVNAKITGGMIMSGKATSQN